MLRSPVISWQAFSVMDVALSRFRDNGHIVSPTPGSIAELATE